MIIHRKHKPGSKPEEKKYIYTYAKDGRPVTDPSIMEALRKMAVPPAWVNVKIDLTPGAKIIFQGYDDKRRLQQKYSAAHNKRATKAKYCRILEFASVLPRIHADIRRHILAKRLGENKIIAIILQLMWSCGFRVGNLKYAKLYDNYGISTIRVKHVKLTRPSSTQPIPKLHIEFRGKKGVMNTCEVVDPVMINQLAAIINTKKSPEDHVFTVPGSDRDEPIKSLTVNKWLARYGTITSKDMRTFDVNSMFIDLMNKIHVERAVDVAAATTPAKRKKIAKAVLDAIAMHANNTPAIVKSSYLMSEIYGSWVEHPKAYRRMFVGPTSPRVMYVNYLVKYCS